MKYLTTNMMFAAAALVIAAGAAQAQQLKAEVPFSFQAQGTVMPAGEYRVERLNSHNGTTIFKVRNVDANRTIVAMPYEKNNAAAGDAALAFECSGGHCALAKVDTGDGSAYRFPTKHAKGEDTRVAVIRAVLAKGL